MLARLVYLLCALSLSLYAWAEEAPRPTPAAPVAADGLTVEETVFVDPYDIEIVIFEYPNSDGDEAWPEDPGQPDLTGAVGDLMPGGLPGQHALRLPEDAKQLGPVAYTLNRRGLSVRAHEAWRLDVQDRDTPAWYLIGDQRLYGLIQVSKGRFLHLNTDLILKPDDQQLFRIQLHRRMRNGELHYLDHPKAGIIIRTARVELERSATASTD